MPGSLPPNIENNKNIFDEDQIDLLIKDMKKEDNINENFSDDDDVFMNETVIFFY